MASFGILDCSGFAAAARARFPPALNPERTMFPTSYFSGYLSTCDTRSSTSSSAAGNGYSGANA